MSQRSVPAPFLTKAYELVDDTATNDVVSWSESGNTFVVWKHADFAKDLLPKYFKHNNFSSFVRQLNTYGFRKIVPDKWEFANENFKQGQKELLRQIKRRKAVPASGKSGDGGGGSGGGNNSGSNSGGDDMGSTSMGSVEETITADLSGENEKLKKDNEKLSSELAQTKKQCDELVAFLKDSLNVGPDQINRIIRQGSYGSSLDAVRFDDDEKNEVAKGESGSGDGSVNLKLFGVWLNGKEKMKIGANNGNCCNKRGREDQMGFGGPNKELKNVV